MEQYKSVPPWGVTDSQVVAFRRELGAVVAGLAAAAKDDTMPFWGHCRGADVWLRVTGGRLAEYLGKVGEHRLSRGHREAFDAVRQFLKAEPLATDAPEQWVEACQDWQRRVLACKRGLAAAAQGELARRRRKGKDREHLQLVVPVGQQEVSA
jgi:hypothetical protein